MYSGGKGHQIFQIYGIYYIYSTVKHQCTCSKRKAWFTVQHKGPCCIPLPLHWHSSQCNERLRSYPCIPLCCILASDHETLAKFWIFSRSQDRHNTTQRRHPASHCEPSSRVHSIYNVSQIATSLSHLIYHLCICSSNIISSYSHLHSIPAIEFPLQEDATHTYSIAWRR